MKEVILLKQGEIILKGLNRRRFEDLLRKNICTALRAFPEFQIREAQSTIYISFPEGTDLALPFAALQKIFGIVSLTQALEGSYDFDKLKQQAAEYLAPALNRVKTFKVIARRADKRYLKNSPQICAELGEFLLERFPHLTVDVHTPEATVFAEVREGSIYLHTDPVRGAGGLPVGTGGRGLLMLSGGFDSPVAGYLMAKRGLEISAIHFESPPYTSPRAREKVIQLARKLSVYTTRLTLHIVPFTEIQEHLRDNCREELFTVLLRREMIRIACWVAEQEGSRCLITGESLGQVASQTLGAICCTDQTADRPILRPLIGTDKQDIIDLARKIDTFETSSLPYEDCCTVFTPKHPKTNPSLEEILREEEKTDTKPLIDRLEIVTERITPWN